MLSKLNVQKVASMLEAFLDPWAPEGEIQTY